MFGSDWELRTPMGRFRLVRSRGELEYKPTEDDLWALLFFCECALGHELEARQTILALRARLEGTPYYPHHAEYLNPSECAELARWVAFGIQADAIRFEKQRPPRTRVVAAHQQKPYTPPKPTTVEEEDHFIGLRLKDQKKQPVRNSRVRVTFPDGTHKEAKTNSAGEVLLKGLAITGNAKIELLDFCTPGAAEAPVWPEEKEYRVKVTDEAGNGVPNVWVKFSEGKKYNLIPADGSGVAVYKTTADEVSASFHDVGELASAMKTVWNQAAALAHADWLKPEVGKRTVVAMRGSALKELLPADGATEAEQYSAFKQLVLVAGEEHEISVQPHVSMARLVGVNFDTSKSFLLPTALPTLRRIKELYEAHSGETLMIVGHADASGGASPNEKLSLERAQAVMAFLLDDVDAWLAWYGVGDTSKCWGAGEDRQMLRGIVARKSGLAKPDAKSYQVWHNALAADQRAKNWALLEEDGKLGEITRAQLIGDYMNLDGTTLPTNMRVVIHGCGEAFPLPKPIVSCAWERFSDMRNRRVEFFFFDQAVGITPMPADNTSALGSTEYPAWLAKAEIEDLTTEAGLKEVTFVEMHDALFRTNSAVILPEGEDPTNTAGGGRALTAVGLFATVLRYNEEHPSSVDASGKDVPKKLLITGHTDTKGEQAFNQPLSEERAKVALALITGGTQGRTDFAKLCQKRHDDIDLTQIFHWVADSLDFDCKPSLHNQAPHPNTITKFKKAYNEHFDALFADIPGAARLSPVDGTQNEALWGAIFDCYEHNLRLELGDMETSKEGKDELDRLRGLVKWVDSSHQTMGFGERFPIDNVTKKEFRSQSNRRIEVMMFDEGEEPDLAAAVADPEVMETYLPGAYGKVPVKPMVSARPWKAYWEKKLDPKTGKDLPANADQARKMIVEARGLPAGETMVFIVEQRIDGAFNAKMPPIATQSTDGGGESQFGDWFNEDHVDYKGALSDGSLLPSAVHRFEVECGGRRKVSADLPYADFVDVTHVFQDTNVPLSAAPYVLRTPWASRPGKTDDKGRVRVDGLPPGGALIDIGSVHLIDSFPTPVDGGDPVVAPPTQQITLRLLDQDYAPRAGVQFYLGEYPSEWVGETDADGLLTANVPTSLTTLTLLYDGGEVAMEIATLPGVDTIGGVQRRLNNLGYDAGPTTDTLNDQVEQALLAFRRKRGLGDPASGASVLDDATKNSLKEAHGH